MAIATVAAPGQAQSAGEAGTELPPRPSPALLLAICLGAFVGMADATIVAVGLDPLARHFGMPLTAGQEVLALYLIVVTATLPTLGRLGDRFGRRGAYLSGFVVFGLGSIVCAVAPQFWILLAGRTIQAVGGGLLTAGSLALIATHAPRGRTGRSVALLVILQAVAGLVAPPLGGVLVALGGWQAMFWAGVPVAVVGLVAGVRIIPHTHGRHDAGIDIAGAILLAGLLIGVGAGIASLDGPVIGTVPAAVWLSVAWISLLLLVPAEMIAARPIIDGRLFRQPRFGAAAAASFLSTGTLMSCFALLPFWLESAHGATTVMAGIAFLPIGIGIGVMARRGGRLGDAGRTRVATTVGMAAAASGFLLAALAAQLNAWLLLAAGLFIIGCGNGLFSSPNTAAAVRTAPRNVLGSAAGFLSTARNAGVIVGLAVTGSIYTALADGQGGPAADAVASGLFIGAACVCAGVALLTQHAYRAVGHETRHHAGVRSTLQGH